MLFLVTRKIACCDFPSPRAVALRGDPKQLFVCFLCNFFDDFSEDAHVAIAFGNSAFDGDAGVGN